MLIRVLLILFLINIGISAETGKKLSYNEYILDIMERRCKVSEKEQAAKKYKKDIVTDSSSAVVIALVKAYSMHNVVPKLNTSVWIVPIGKHKEYWFVSFYPLMKNHNIEVEFRALVSRNSGTFLCGLLIKAEHWEFE